VSKARKKGDSVVTGRPGGRPRKTGKPLVPYEEVDRLLVFGESVPTEDGRNTTIFFPSYRDLALRFGVSNSVIAAYSKRHNCLKRREVAQARVEAKVDDKLVELRAEAIALSREDELRIIDTYLGGFEKSLADGTVRYDDPAHFDRFCRLKEFLLGGADSRQEVHASLSLEDLQARHRRMLKQIEEMPAAERRSAEPALPAPMVPGLPEGSNPPAIPSATAPEKPTGRLPVGFDPTRVTGQFSRLDSASSTGGSTGRFCRSDSAPTGAPDNGWDQDADSGARTPQGANVARTARNVGPDGRAPGPHRGWPDEEDEP
jgi:hypothetical protein